MHGALKPTEGPWENDSSTAHLRPYPILEENGLRRQGTSLFLAHKAAQPLADIALSPAHRTAAYKEYALAPAAKNGAYERSNAL